MPKTSKIIIGIKDIKAFFNPPISEPLFRALLKIGLPAIQINGYWYAHTDNLEDFFKKITIKQIELDIPENGDSFFTP